MGFFFRGVSEYLTHRTGQPIYTPIRDGRWPEVYILGRQQPEGSETWLQRFYTPELVPEFMTRQGLMVWRLSETELADGE